MLELDNGMHFNVIQIKNITSYQLKLKAIVIIIYILYNLNASELLSQVNCQLLLGKQSDFKYFIKRVFTNFIIIPGSDINRFFFQGADCLLVLIIQINKVISIAMKIHFYANIFNNQAYR